MERIVTQAPTARIDYAVDWEPFLAPTDGDTIQTATFSVTPSDGTLVIENASIVGMQHRAFVKGGESGSVYRVTSSIETAQGRKQPQSFAVIIRST